MVYCAIAKKIDAPADYVWSLVNFRGCEVLIPVPGQLESVTFEGEGIGAKRIFQVDRERLGGGAIVEQLVSIDEEARSYEYRILDNGPLPWTGYRGEIGVTPCGPDACAIKFSVDITPIDISDEEARHIFITHCLMDVARIRKYVAEHAPAK